MWVTYSGWRAERRSPIGADESSDGPVGAGVQRRLGFRGGVVAVKGQKWPILGLKPVSRRDVTESSLAHVATWQRALPNDVAT